MQKNPLPILYTFRRCPYAMRARMAIYVAEINVESIEVSLKNKPQRLLEYSPKGTVPVLVNPNGDVIEQSRDIMLWALHQNDPHDWLMKDDVQTQKHMKDLVDLCDNEFKPLLDRYKYFDRYPELSQEDYRQQAEFFVKILDTNLNRQNFLVNEDMRFADAAIFPFIRQFANTDREWFDKSPYKHVQRWLNACIQTSIFDAIMINAKINS